MNHRDHIIVVPAYGGPDVLRVQPLAEVPPGPTEVRVRHGAIGVNYVDVYHRTGLYPLPLPGTPGLEAAGTIEAVGAQVAGLRVGQRVAYVMPTPGSYASARNVPAERVLALPDEVSDTTAAAGLMRGITAHMLLRHVLRARAGETLFVHAAAGGLGLMLTQWAKADGLRVLGTVGSHAKAELARAAGLDHAILYRETDFVEAVLQATGGAGADYAVDGIGGETLRRSVQAVRRFGMLASTGMVEGTVDFDLALEAAPRSVAVSKPSVTRFIADVAAYRQAAAETLARMGGGLQVAVAGELPLRDAAQAHRLLEGGTTSGVLILRPE